MIIKCMDSQQNKANVGQGNKKTMVIKLPNLDPNCIFTSRLGNNKYINPASPQSKSMAFLTKFENQQFPRNFAFNNKLPKYSPVKKRVPSNTMRKLSEQKKAKRFSRMNTQPVNGDVRSKERQKSQFYSVSTQKQKIAQKIIKITQELGMNKADYQNYMKANRKQYPNSTLYNQKKKKEVLNINCTNATNYNLNHTYNKIILSQSQKRLNKNNLTISHIQTVEKQDQNRLDQNNQEQNTKQFVRTQQSQEKSMSIYRCILKLKPMPKTQKFISTKRNTINKIFKKTNQQNTMMNKSIRGWTKYGKIVQDIQP